MNFFKSLSRRSTRNTQILSFAGALALVGGLLVGARPASADTLAFYDFGAAATPSSVSSDTDLNSTATNIGFTNFAGGQSGFTGNAGNPAASAFALPTNTPTTFSPTGGYLGFSVSAATGSTINFDTLTFNFLTTHNGPGNTNQFTGQYDVRSSLTNDNFATTLGGSSGLSVVYAAQQPFTNVANVNLSGFQNINAATPVNFRIYFLDDTAAGGPAALRVDNVSLAGTVNVAAVPEPSTYAMMVIGIGAVIWMSRRRKRETTEATFSSEFAL